MNFKRNTFANYIGQGYKALIGIIVMPFYLTYLGAEAYGLIGFFIMLQSALQLLDMGLRPTLARESSLFCANSINAIELTNLVRTMEWIFYTTGFIFSALIIYFNNFIVNSWLTFENLTIEQVSMTITIMGVVVSLRWSTSIYRGVISGFEKQVWLNSYDIIMNSLRFLGIFILFHFIEPSIQVFFFYQLIIAFFESLIIFLYTYKILPKVKVSLSFNIHPLLKIKNFALTIAITSTLWTIISQIDKIILSGILNLENYGYFSLSIVISSSIYILSNSIGNALMPRLTVYNEQKNNKDFLKIFFLATELTLIILIPICSLLIFFGEEILFLWTNDLVSSKKANSILIWYILGNLFLSLSAFAYYLQYAHGKLNLHLKGQLIYAFLLIPLQIYASYNFGAIGTGVVWFSVNFLYLFIWVPYIYREFLITTNTIWFKQIVKSITMGFILCYGLSISFNLDNILKLEKSLIFLFYFLLIAIAIIFTTQYMREYFLSKLSKIKKR
jgi:O-antigen/teichoic acid export membrane protein